MRALFSKRSDNSSATASSSQSEADKRRGRTISSGSLFNKSQRYPSLYADPQDIFYPATATNGTGIQTGQRPSHAPTSYKAQGKRRSNLALIPNDDVGDAPASASSMNGGPARRASKSVFHSWRGKGLPLPIGKDAEGGSDTRNGIGVPKTSKGSPPTDAPFYVVAPRSLSTPAVRRQTAKEVVAPPKVPTEYAHGLDLAPLSAKSESLTLSSPSIAPASKTVEVDGDATPKQNSLAVFAAPSRTSVGFLDVTPDRTMARSAPSSPLFTTQSSSSPGTTPSAKEDETFSLKNTFRKRKGASKSTDALAETVGQSGRDMQTTARPMQTASKSQDLASELNDLAVAYEEGLLGQDEYRMLRQSVFEKMMGRAEMEVPRERRLQDRTVQRDGVESPGNKTPLLSPAPSMRSKRSSKSNLASLFRRNSKADILQQGGQNLSPSNGLKAGNASMKSDAPSMKSRKSSSGLTMESQVYHARRARTIRGTHLDTSSLSSHAQGGGKGSSIFSASALSASGLSVSDGSALLGSNYAEKGSDEIQAEIAVVEAEGKRIIEGFRSLQMNAIGQHNLGFASLKRATKGIDEVEGDGSDLLDGFVMVEGGDFADGHQERGSLSMRGDMLGGLMRKTRSFGSVDAITNANSRRAKTKGEPTAPPTSYRGVPVAPASSVSPRTDLPEGEGEEEEVVKLRAELADIARRRDEVSRKYADRLGFLRSTLRSAKIREGLK